MITIQFDNVVNGESCSEREGIYFCARKPLNWDRPKYAFSSSKESCSKPRLGNFETKD